MRALPILFAMYALAAGAQPSPPLTWEGQVDGIVVLHIRGERVDVEYRQGLPVERQSYHFARTLPDFRQDVRVEVREGRGLVHVTQQPRIDNSFTADVTIEDRQDRASFYSLAVFWDEGAAPSGPMDHLTWSGRVDGELVVACRASQCDAMVRAGEPAGRPHFRFTHPLPDREVRVWLDQTEGRADIRIEQQPSSQNGYSVKVLVRAFGGGSDCSFVLSWQRVKTGKIRSQ